MSLLWDLCSPGNSLAVAVSVVLGHGEGIGESDWWFDIVSVREVF